MKGIVYSSSILYCEQYLKVRGFRKGGFLMVAPSSMRSARGIPRNTIVVSTNHIFSVDWCELDDFMRERFDKVIVDLY